MARKIRLLLVDDEEEFVTYLGKRLSRHDIRVVSYTDPIRALEETRDQSFDVGLLDLKMPGLDGAELLSRLKERDPKIEVIMLTGHGSISSAFKAASDGAFDYLLKPCDFDDVVRAISNAYARRVRASHSDKGKIDEIMASARNMGPLEFLRELKKSNDSLRDPLADEILAGPDKLPAPANDPEDEG